jgi:hypothetical protein
MTGGDALTLPGDRLILLRLCHARAGDAKEAGGNADAGQ